MTANKKIFNGSIVFLPLKNLDICPRADNPLEKIGLLANTPFIEKTSLPPPPLLPRRSPAEEFL